MRRLLALLALTFLLAAACGSDPAVDGSLGEVAGGGETTGGEGEGPVTAEAASDGAVAIRRSPDDVPPPIGARPPETVDIDLEAIELDGELGEGTTYEYWTFGGQVPGPLLRVREGDTVNLNLSNAADNSVSHNIDLHAVNGPGGGAVGTNVAPGEEKGFSFEALNPGVYVYHCAFAPVPTHISNGMYVMIIVEPEGGLPPVDKEFYIMQGELYTEQPTGTPGHLTFDFDRTLSEDPTYVVWNGAWQSLTEDNALMAAVGDRVRIFAGNGGPNLISSFHVIGEIFDLVHQEAASEPVTNIQTTALLAGGAAWVEFDTGVPGTYVIVDHSLTRAFDKGALGHLVVEGPEDPAIFSAPDADG